MKAGFKVIAVVSVLLAAVALAPLAGPAVADSPFAWTQLDTQGIFGSDVKVLMPTTEFDDNCYCYIPFDDNGSVPILAWDGDKFQQVGNPGLRDPNNTGFVPGVEYGDRLYCGTMNSTTGGQLWRTTGGTGWQQIGEDFFSGVLTPQDEECVPLGVQDGKLLVGFNNVGGNGAKVYAYDGTNFTQANAPGFGYGANRVTNGATVEGEVHVVAYERSGGGPLVPLVYKGGTSWGATASPGFQDYNNFGSFWIDSDGERISVGTANMASGGEAWLYQGGTWSQVGSDGMGAGHNTLFTTLYNDRVYISGTDFEGEHMEPVGPTYIYRPKSDGSYERWTQDGFGDSDNGLIVLASTFRGDFLAGTYNDNGGQAWRSPLPPPDTYYFAEGTTRKNFADGNFDEWLCVQNPNDEEVDVDLTYMLSDGSDSIQKQMKVAASSRTTINVRNEVGSDKDVSVKVQGSDPIVVERPMYFSYHSQWTGGHVVIGASSPEKTWYFAEGTTRDNLLDGSFETWLCIQNPGTTGAAVDITYMLGDGSTEVKQVEVAPRSRHTQSVNADLGKDKDASIKVESNVPVVVERPMYFNYHSKWSGGHDTMGAVEPSKELYFAEGCTYSWNNEWLCIQNPNTEQATVTLDYQLGEGDPVTRQLTIDPTTRHTVNVVDDVGLDKNVSVSVSSDVPVVAERPMYFNYHNKWPGGHDVMGTSEPCLRYYFAEGTTRDNFADGRFDEWVCIQNPGDVGAIVVMTFMKSDGSIEEHNIGVNAGKRETVSVDDLLGNDVDASLYVMSDMPVVVERPMYFHYHTMWPGGSDTIGATYVR